MRALIRLPASGGACPHSALIRLSFAYRSRVCPQDGAFTLAGVSRACVRGREVIAPIRCPKAREGSGAQMDLRLDAVLDPPLSARVSRSRSITTETGAPAMKASVIWCAWSSVN